MTPVVLSLFLSAAPTLELSASSDCAPELTEAFRDSEYPLAAEGEVELAIAKGATCELTARREGAVALRRELGAGTCGEVARAAVVIVGRWLTSLPSSTWKGPHRKSGARDTGVSIGGRDGAASSAGGRDGASSSVGVRDGGASSASIGGGSSVGGQDGASSASVGGRDGGASSASIGGAARGGREGASSTSVGGRDGASTASVGGRDGASNASVGGRDGASSASIGGGASGGRDGASSTSIGGGASVGGRDGGASSASIGGAPSVGGGDGTSSAGGRDGGASSASIGGAGSVGASSANIGGAGSVGGRDGGASSASVGGRDAGAPSASIGGRDGAASTISGASSASGGASTRDAGGSLASAVTDGGTTDASTRDALLSASGSGIGVRDTGSGLETPVLSLGGTLTRTASDAGAPEAVIGRIGVEPPNTTPIDQPPPRSPPLRIEVTHLEALAGGGLSFPGPSEALDATVSLEAALTFNHRLRLGVLGAFDFGGATNVLDERSQVRGRIATRGALVSPTVQLCLDTAVRLCGGALLGARVVQGEVSGAFVFKQLTSWQGAFVVGPTLQATLIFSRFHLALDASLLVTPAPPRFSVEALPTTLSWPAAQGLVRLSVGVGSL